MKKVVPLEGFGGGGTPLNFKIVAYATEEELAAAQPKENTIGVITDVPITGYKFSATEPEDMVDGEVWICVGSDSTVAFDIIDGAKMYPLSVKQCVSGTWVNKTVMSYQNGEWVEWIPEGALYYKGNEITEKTGGWSASAWTPNSNYTNNGFAFEKEKDHMTLSFHPTTQAGRDWAISSNNKIDMSKYNTLRIDAEHSWKGTKIGLSSVKPTSSTTASWVASQVFSSQKDRGETTLDISDCNSSYYVVVWAYSDHAVDTYLNVYGIIAE